jgi:2-C-methyl-D-erythritol 4-phosphate cytidylyltransferase/2-C-methyl-D-erythritol 2,4-cyclodiphosphate synthase
LNGFSLLALTVDALAAEAPDAPILVVIHPGDRDFYEAALRQLSAEASRLLAPVAGGATRQESVRAGLEALAKRAAPPAFVLIHDAARPFVSGGLVRRAIAAAAAHGAAIPGLPLTDTIKRVDAAGRIAGGVDRAHLCAVQTPQAFAFGLVLDAHRKAAEAGRDSFTDDAAVAEWAGHAVHVFAGDPANIKITTPEDFARAEAFMQDRLSDIRTGQGFDVHAFGPGDHVWLGGAKIAHSQGLVGHSDADVLMHAVTDAIYGTLADGDIGAHFPPSDPRWKGAASEIFLRHAMERLRARGGMLAHLDATVICELPKVGPHRDTIRARLSEIMGVSVSRLAVKATTTERLGFTGRGEGIAAMALATIRLPPQDVA